MTGKNIAEHPGKGCRKAEKIPRSTLRRKLTAAMAAVLVFLTMVTGCSTQERAYERQGEKAIEYICEKYGQKFTPVPDNVGTYIRELGKLICRTEGMDESECVTITMDGDGTTFHDNYFGYLVRDEVESYAKNMVEPVFPECKVFYDVSWNPFPDDLVQGNTLNDYYRQENGIRMIVTAYVKAGEGLTKQQYTDRVSKIEEAALDTGHAYIFRVFVLEEESYEKIDRNNQDDFWVKNDKAKQNGNPLCVYEYEKVFCDGEVL